MNQTKEYSNSILLGDAVSLMREMPNEFVHLIITSPPYNVGINYDNYDDNLKYEDYLLFLKNVFTECYRILVNGGRICINVPSINIGKGYVPLYSDVICLMREIGYIMRGDIIWNKSQITKRTAWGSFCSPSNPYILPPYEFVLVFSKGSLKLEGDKDKIDITKEEFISWTNSLWNIKPETRNTGHPAPFPEQLAMRLIKLYSYIGNIVLDPFGGSGTTCYVAKQLNRKYIYIDVSEKYYEMAKNRIEQPALF